MPTCRTVRGTHGTVIRALTSTQFIHYSYVQQLQYLVIAVWNVAHNVHIWRIVRILQTINVADYRNQYLSHFSQRIRYTMWHRLIESKRHGFPVRLVALASQPILSILSVLSVTPSIPIILSFRLLRHDRWNCTRQIYVMCQCGTIEP